MTLRNSGKRPVTTSLRTDGPATVSPKRVTVPPGRTATVTVSLRVARPAADTGISGRLTATPDQGPVIGVPYLLAVRHLAVQAAPDPSDGHSTVHIAPPTHLAAPPVVTVTPPRGIAVEYASTLDPANGYYRAEVTGSVAGAYRVSVRGTAGDRTAAHRRRMPSRSPRSTAAGIAGSRSAPTVRPVPSPSRG